MKVTSVDGKVVFGKIDQALGRTSANLGDSGRAAADDHHFGISPGHTFIPATVEGAGRRARHGFGRSRIDRERAPAHKLEQ